MENGRDENSAQKRTENVDKREALTAEGRLTRLEAKVNLLVALAVLLMGAAGGVYWKIWDIGKDLGLLTSRVDGHDKEAFMQLISSLQTEGGNTWAAKELRETVQSMVSDTIEKDKRGEPIQPGLYYEFGEFSVNNGKLEAAVDYFQQAIKGNALDYRAFSSMGGCYVTLADKQKDKREYYASRAIDALKKAIEINPSFAKAHNNLGIAYILTGQRKAAIDEWDTAIKIDYKLPRPYYNLACMYGSEGDRGKAIEFLEKAVVNYGYNNLAELDADECFNNVRSDQRFSSLREIISMRTKNAVAP